MMNGHMNGHQMTAVVNDNVQRRRNAHTAAEKKRRDSINKGFDDLQKVVPQAMYEFDPETGQKISKPIILKRTIDHIEKLAQTHDQLIEEYKSLKSEIKSFLKMNDALSLKIKIFEKNFVMDALNVIHSCYNNIYPEERYSLSSAGIISVRLIPKS